MPKKDTVFVEIKPKVRLMIAVPEVDASKDIQKSIKLFLRISK